MSQKFRYDINGLRAYAVALVVLFHFEIMGFTGGFIGVDIFFVISGFLMTKIIIDSLDNHNFSLIQFYTNRSIRIIPALAILFFALLAIGWFTLLPTEYKDLGKHVFASIFFISNFIYWRESGYFDVDAHNKILLHTWSLSAEWQFYLLLPLYIILFYKIFKGKVIGSLITLFFLSLISSYLITLRDPSAAFYLLPTRAWEMLLGSALFFLPKVKNKHLSSSIEITGFVLILISLFLFTPNTPWPSLYALIPTIGTVLILWAANQQSIFTNNKIFQSIGSASYSIYLWHWPIVFFIYKQGELDNLYYVAIGIILSFVLGYLSYFYVEKKTISLFKKLSLKKTIITISSFCLVLSLIALTIYKKDGIKSDYRAASTNLKATYVEKYLAEERDHYEAFWLQCNTYANLTKKGFNDIDPSCVAAKQQENSIFLWGDSHSQALSWGIRENFKDASFYQVGSSGCAPSLQPNEQLEADYKTACDKANNLALSYIEKIKPNTVIIAQANSHEKNNWPEIVSRLQGFGVQKIIVLGPVPQWKPSLPKIYIKGSNFMNTDTKINDKGLDLSIIETDLKAVKLFKNIENPSVKYISLINQMCELRNDGKYYCQASIEETNGLMQYDYGHLTKEGSTYVVRKYIKPYI